MDIPTKISEARRDPRAFFAVNEMRTIAVACHPDRWPDKQDWAKSTFAEFQSLHELSLAPAESIGKYEIISTIATGDLRKVCRCREGLIKCPVVAKKSANQLIAKEAELCRQLAEDHKGETFENYFPVVLDSFVDEKRRYNVLSEKIGYSLAEIIAKHATLDDRHIGWMMKRVLVALAASHDSGYSHNAVVPEHLIFGIDDHSLVLTGWIHAEKHGEKIKVVPSKWKSWYQRKDGSPACDIAMASRCMLEAVGDDCHKNIRAFLKGCLLPVHDAFALHEEFDTLLHRTFGAPRFHVLEMEI